MMRRILHTTYDLLYTRFVQPLSPLDGRYAVHVHALRPFFTEDALMKSRVRVELEYLIALAEERGIHELRAFSEREKKAIAGI